MDINNILLELPEEGRKIVQDITLTYPPNSLKLKNILGIALSFMYEGGTPMKDIASSILLERVLSLFRLDKEYVLNVTCKERHMVTSFISRDPLSFQTIYTAPKFYTPLNTMGPASKLHALLVMLKEL